VSRVIARAPGRVNLIGDHTDYTGGLVLPMAIDLETVITGERGHDRVVLRSSAENGEVALPLAVHDPMTVTPAWGRYVAGVVAERRPSQGFEGQVTSSLPVGAGLSSSAALEVAVALALGFDGSRLELAELCQRAEHAATGVPSGIMDQLASAAGVAGHALRIDCASLDVRAVPMPEDIDVVVVHSGEQRRLVGTPYAERREQCEAAAAVVGPLPQATLASLEVIADPVMRRRARHVVTECARVDEFVAALSDGRREVLGGLMAASHASLRDDFEVSTPVLDALVDRLTATPGVLGARLTGAGFGGCVVALTEPGVNVPGWRVRPAAGASVS
jgi:galactokinase